jgi:hypothetical protein
MGHQFQVQIPCLWGPNWGIMTLMQDYFIFDESELVRIGVVCLGCNTESVFDLRSKKPVITATDCPGCGKQGFLGSYTIHAKQSFNWVTLYRQALKSHKGSVGIKLYFEKQGTA